MKVFIACESSGVGRRAFLAAGHDVISSDLLSADDGETVRHIQGDCFETLDALERSGWHPDLIIAHPTCTYLTNAGVRHMHSVPSRNGVLTKIHGEERWARMRESAAFFNRFKGRAKYVCIENPVPHGYAREIIGHYTQLIQPWHFGHEETKATCLWLEGLPKLQHTNVVGPPPKDKELRKKWAKCHMTSPGPDRWKTRSKSYSGILEAMAEQWGIL